MKTSNMRNEDSNTFDYKEPELSSSKLRTKVDFVKVPDGAHHKIELLKLGERLYTNKNGTGWIDWKRAKGWSIADIESWNLYRRNVRPIDCFDDVNDYIEEHSSGDCDFEITPDREVVRINAEMPKAQWFDLARVLLEQEGE